MANVNVLLNSASIQVLDGATLTYRINTPVGTVTLPATAADYDSFVQIAGGAGTILDLPGPTAWFVYVKNLDVAANLSVLFQVTGGALLTLANAPMLTPGGVFIYANPIEFAGAGMIAITLVSSAGPSPAEILLAG
jgi:hypothetical protein